MSEVKFKLAAGTNVGLFRQNNEDNFVVCPDLSTSEWLIPQGGEFADLGEMGALLVVADGMGGANAGEVASAIAVQTIQEQFTPDNIRGVVNDDAAIQNFMKDTVKMADMNILNRSKSDQSSRGMGTTIVMAWILGRRAYVCWCGDSRCYAMNEMRGLRQVSKDHSFVQELVDRGELDPEFMHDHSMSNVITRCLGDMEKRAVPETRVYELSNGDSIMLCSDGLSGLCDDMEISGIISQYGDYPMDCTNELISAALNNGGHDNVTVAICTVETADAGEITYRNSKRSVERPGASVLKDTVKPYLKLKPVDDEVTEADAHTVDVAQPVQAAETVETEQPEENVQTESSENAAAADVSETNEEEIKTGETDEVEKEKTEEEKDKKEETGKETEETTKPETESAEKKHSLWKIIITVILLLAIIGCCVYYWLTFAPAAQ